jgi:hypothetical protein
MQNAMSSITSRQLAPLPVMAQLPVEAPAAGGVEVICGSC